MNQDPYKILGVSPSTDQKEVAKAYRKLAKKYHPDLNPGNKQAEAKFKEISNAYDLIGTQEARSKYDRGEEAWTAGGEQKGNSNQWKSHNFSFGGEQNEDIFDQLFGRHARRGFSSHGHQAKGENLYYKMEISFVDSVLGAEKEITLGNNKKLSVKIPPGIETGTQLRFAGQGGAVPMGGTPGDAFIEIRVLPSNIFKRVGQDIELVVLLSLGEAILGGEVKIPTVDGPILLKIPPGASSGKKLRVRGKGVKTSGKLGGRGDQINVLQIESPSVIDDQLKSFMQTWSQNHHYNPRPREWG